MIITTIKHPWIEFIKNINHTGEYFILTNLIHFQWLVASENDQYEIQWIITTDISNNFSYNFCYVKPTILYHIFKDKNITFVALIKFKNNIVWENHNIIILDHVLDYGNIGSIVRNSYLMGVKEIIMVRPFNFFYNRIIESSRGLIFKAKISWYSSFTQYDEEGPKDYNYYITDCKSEGLQTVNHYKKALVFGNETSGVSDYWLDKNHENISIPMVKNDICDSINVTAAAAIIVFFYQNIQSKNQ